MTSNYNNGSIKQIVGSTSFSDNWKIINFAIDNCNNMFDEILNMKTGEYITSQEFDDGDSTMKWFIELYPSGYKSEYENQVGLFLGVATESSILKSKQINVKATFEMSILNSEGEPEYTKRSEDEVVFRPENTHEYPEFQGRGYDGHGWFDFIQKDEMKNNLNKLLNKNGQLVIRCLLKKSGNKRLRTDTIQNDKIVLDIKNNKCWNCSKYEASYKTLSALLNNKQNSDATIIVKEKEFSVHKAILSQKSEMFQSYFTDNKNEEFIKMNEFSEVCVMELLRFIYLGEVENLKDIASELLKLALTYKVESLQILCICELKKNLNITNSIERLILAHKNNLQDLKADALKVIIENINELIHTDEWKKLDQSHLSSDIIKSMFTYYNITKRQ